jgi:hypothetical protein
MSSISDSLAWSFPSVLSGKSRGEKGLFVKRFEKLAMAI